MAQKRDSEFEKGESEGTADKVEDVGGKDVVALTRRVLWKTDTR